MLVKMWGKGDTSVLWVRVGEGEWRWECKRDNFSAGQSAPSSEFGEGRILHSYFH